ncbi:cell division protein SepF [Williamsia maris]|uniref:Cell division protein SepF n=1 Tax=Williamsia maris TaxID=72806 RepID=A0ABT1HFC6_9NOCA|nr:cell division protein SepF [Williamsia maris]MCP2176952.1 cell division inhibitor SepF [Williamsia maris]
MSSMQKFKAYFGMVPPGDYEDDYLDEPGHPRRDSYERDYRDEYYGRSSYRTDRGFEADEYGDEVEFDRVPEYAYAGPVRSSVADRVMAERSAPMERLGRPSRLEPLGGGGMSARAGGVPRGAGRTTTRGALAMDSHESLDRVFEEGNPLAKITTLRPRDYSEARTIGERFRDGSPVIMDLVEMSNEDAKRLVDFAAGLAFALRGAFDKVATKVFLLSPADIDVSAEDRRKIAETGFYNHS